MIEVDGAQPNHGAERLLPLECGQLQWQLRIWQKVQAIGARRFLILVDHQRPDESHTVIAEMPALRVFIGSTGERSPSENQQIAACIQEMLDGGP